MKKGRPLWRTVLVLVVAIALITVGLLSGNRLQAVRGWIGGVFAPVQTAFTSTVNGINQYFVERARVRQLQGMVNELSDRVSVLSMVETDNQELQKEVARLNALLGVAGQYPELTKKKARVVGKGNGNFFDTFTIDLGGNDGIEPDMAIISQGGLVGRVVEVQPTYATVMSIIDGRSSLGGIVERTRDNGMVHGSLNLSENDDSCRMEYLPYETELVYGDRILTSGLDGVYPKGLLIGTVKEITRESQTTQSIVIKPGVDFRHLEEVLVITSEFAGPDETLGVEDNE